MHIEAALIDRIGDTGRKLHTARSRNDQVATDLKLWVRDGLDRIDERLTALQRAFLGAAERHDGVILPGYTHMQRAQARARRRTISSLISRSFPATATASPTPASA